MTLQEFFDACTNNPEIIGFYFVALPLTAFLASVFGKGEGHLSPWKYLYTVLVYAATVPGIFAIVLNVYLFLFERLYSSLASYGYGINALVNQKKCAF